MCGLSPRIGACKTGLVDLCTSVSLIARKGCGSRLCVTPHWLASKACVRSVFVAQLRADLLRHVPLPSFPCHQKSPTPWGHRPSYRLSQDFQGRPPGRGWLRRPRRCQGDQGSLEERLKPPEASQLSRLSGLGQVRRGVGGIHLGQDIGSYRARGCLAGSALILNAHVAWYKKLKPVKAK